MVATAHNPSERVLQDIDGKNGNDKMLHLKIKVDYFDLFHTAVLEISNCPLAPHGLNLLGAS